MANRDPTVSPEPDTIDLNRKSNRHYSIGLGIHHRIGSNAAHTVSKRTLLTVPDRIPDLRCDPARTAHYETTANIQGIRHLPANITPGTRLGPGLDNTPKKLHQHCTEQRLTEPVTTHKEQAQV